MNAATTHTANAPSTGRPLRRDAARNHELVLAAAREVLGEVGTDASMETIAARAGVGVGTVYRRFPSKDALIDELVRLILDELTDAAHDALARADGTGLEHFLHALGQSFLEHHLYADKLMGNTDATRADELRDLIGALHRQAIHERTIAPEVTLGDVMTTCWALRGVIETTAATAPRAWERHLVLHLAGLRPQPRPDKLPRALTQPQLDHIAGKPNRPT